jgi:hypothetical protein
MSSVLIPGERVRTRERRRERRVGLFGRLRRLDWLLLCALAGIAALGLDVIGTGAGGHAFVVKQEIYLALGVVALFVLSLAVLAPPGEYGADTWKNLENGANCWGGISLDASRGIEQQWRKEVAELWISIHT